MDSAGEIMEILAAFDLTESHRDGAELGGCSHHTVAHCVARPHATRFDLAGQLAGTIHRRTF